MKYPNIGADDFKTVVEKYYYVDKSRVIMHLLHDQVTLITRPRRFGKTLNMSMMSYFYDIEKDSKVLFSGLEITKDSEAMKEMNQYPVIFLTLKEVKGQDYQSAINRFRSLIYKYFRVHQSLLTSDQLDGIDHQILRKYANKTANHDDLQDFLYNMSVIYHKLYQRNVVILIDEYDVPLDSARRNGYYDEMSDFLRTFLGSAFKTNEFLHKGVLTGCLRISKESIFTGLNNFKVRSIFDSLTADDFGFTQDEVDNLLTYYHLEDKKQDIRKWYDGYRFGSSDLYNPWSVLNYISDLIENHHAQPVSYWANSSGNDIVYDYIRHSDTTLQNEFEKLINGQSITKKIKGELTYRQMDDISNIYSFLLFTGYLKPVKEIKKDTYELKIPNLEVKEIYENEFEDWFRDYTRDSSDEFYEALIHGDRASVTRILTNILNRSVSYMDSKESFYHGLILGLLSGYNHDVISNRESGDGRFDVCLKADHDQDLAVLIECKKANSESQLMKDAQSGLNQMEQKHYDETLRQEGYHHIIKYAIAFYKKKCQIIKGQPKIGLR